MERPEPLKGSKLVHPIDPRTLNFANYIDHGALHEIPTKVDLTLKKKTPWRRMGNWTANDCTCAAAGHMIECWTANATREDIVLTREVMEVYIALSGFNPETHANDDGLYYHDVLKYWRKNGIGGHKIKAYTTVNHKDPKLVRAAIHLFGGGYVGFDLPETICHKQTWEVVSRELTGDSAIGSFGGHAVNVVGYDDDYVYCISWGKVKRMTWEFVDTYCYVFYAVISEDFFNAGHSPRGLDLSTLEEDLLNISKAKKTLERDLEALNKAAKRGK